MNGSSGMAGNGPAGISGTGPAGMAGNGPTGMMGTGPAGMAGTGPAGIVGSGPAGIAGTGPAGMAGSGPAGMAGSGPAGMAGNGPAGMTGTGPAGMAGTSPAGMASSGPAGMAGSGPAGIAGTGPAGMMGKGPAGMVGKGEFGKLAFGPPGNPAYGAFGKLGAAKAGMGKVAAGGILAKLVSVGLIVLAVPIGAIFLIGAALFSRKKPNLPARVPTQFIRRSMGQRIAQRTVAGLLALGTGALLWIVGFILYDRFSTHNVSIAAGSSQGESYVVLQAMKTVAARYYPKIKVTVSETGGTTDSLQRLEKGEAHFASAQSDVPVGSTARTVAILFDDTFQLVVHKSSPIAHFAELKGKHIALPRSGGQYSSFLTLATHFGLKEADFAFVGGDDEAANVAFARNEADAIFRVRALHNAEIKDLVKDGNANLIPIEDGAALHVDSPAYNSSIIPKGAHLGSPAVPSADVPTISTRRLLLASQGANKYVVQALTQVLIERRQEIAAAIPATHAAVRPLPAQISQPTDPAGLFAPIHPGALAYYNHDQSGFVNSNIDLIALLLASLVLTALWISELRRLFLHGLKRHSDLYNRQLVAVLEEAPLEGADHAQLRTTLNRMLIRAIRDLDQDKMSESSFRSFHIIWQTAMEVVREKPALEAAQHTDGLAVLPASATERRGISKWLHRSN